jgi:hypothetical protein
MGDRQVEMAKLISEASLLNPEQLAGLGRYQLRIIAAELNLMSTEEERLHYIKKPVGEQALYLHQMLRELPGAKWPELPFDEEFLRIVLLEARVMGKDVTVEPYKTWNNELAWRRTDKYMAGGTEGTMNIEQVYELQATIVRMNQAFSNQKGLMAMHVRKHLCSHKDAASNTKAIGTGQGADICPACGAQLG